MDNLIVLYIGIIIGCITYLIIHFRQEYRHHREQELRLNQDTVERLSGDRHSDKGWTKHRDED